MTERTYSIGEVGKMLRLNTSVLRFWQKEFPQLCPPRRANGRRVYGEKDVALLRRIQNLLHEQRLTIEAARRVLSGTTEQIVPAELARDTGFMAFLQKELGEIRDLLAASRSDAQ